MSNYITLSFDSKNGSDLNQPSFNLNRSIHNIKKVKVNSFEVPHTNYVFSSNYNQIKITEDGYPQYTVSLTAGNYTTTTISAELETQLNASSIASGGSNTFTVSIDADTLKMNIAMSVGNFSIQGSTSSSSPFLGYTTDTGLATNHTGDKVIRLSGYNHFYIHSNIGQFISKNIYNNGSTINDIIARIPITTSSFSDIYYFGESSPYYSCVNSSMDNIYFSCRDVNGYIIDFNGSSFSVQIALLNDETDY